MIFQTRIIPIDDQGTVLLIVVLDEHCIIETVPLNQFTQRIRNFSSIRQFSKPYAVAEDVEIIL